jgi:uncharacterized membrane protein
MIIGEVFILFILWPQCSSIATTETSTHSAYVLLRMVLRFRSWCRRMVADEYELAAHYASVDGC